jgi:hypothetical protein
MTMLSQMHPIEWYRHKLHLLPVAFDAPVIGGWA